MEVFAAIEGRELAIEPRGAAGRALAPEARSSHRRAPHETTILLVDDDPDVIDLLRETLADEGYQLLSANDGEAALVIARQERPDMVVLDWIMPKRDGLSVCRALRARSRPPTRRCAGHPHHRVAPTPPTPPPASPPASPTTSPNPSSPATCSPAWKPGSSALVHLSASGFLKAAGCSKRSRCEAAPAGAREAYCLYVERAAAGANEADGPFSSAC